MYKKFLIFLVIIITMLTSITKVMAANAITTSYVNMRIGPNTDYRILKLLPPKSRLQVRYCQESWCQVSYKQYTGWMSAKYIAYKQTTESKNLARVTYSIERFTVWEPLVTMPLNKEYNIISFESYRSFVQ
ncbi:SH3 domain-containing protein [Bartonella sp. DGB1]|uniref:SH3 domain-containing protein n=1 Tax=Bartonella sp. DGB1 TaxID=3239807 RepID=UPI003525EFF2